MSSITENELRNGLLVTYCNREEKDTMHLIKRAFRLWLDMAYLQ